MVRNAADESVEVLSTRRKAMSREGEAPAEPQTSRSENDSCIYMLVSAASDIIRSSSRFQQMINNTIHTIGNTIVKPYRSGS